jgi:hypothetical protein
MERTNEQKLTEIEVTPEMLEAGDDVYNDWAGVGNYDVPPNPHHFLRRLYSAMEGARLGK